LQIQLESKISDFIILSPYQVKSPYFNQLLGEINAALQHVYNSGTEFLICDGINIDYLNGNSKGKKNLVVATCNQTRDVNNAERVQNGWSAETDNIFADNI
jgi:hypothetical protein